jgi:hypothetical protein
MEENPQSLSKGNTPEFAGMIDAMPGDMRTRFDAWTAMSSQEFASLKASGATAKDSTGKLQALVTDAVEAQSDSIRAAAMATCSALRYSPARFEDDMSRYSDDLVLLGTPPIVPPPHEPTVGLATVFNLAQLVALERLDEFRPGTPRAEKESMLDDLVLKAVELGEILRRWQEVQ